MNVIVEYVIKGIIVLLSFGVGVYIGRCIIRMIENLLKNKKNKGIKMKKKYIDQYGIDSLPNLIDAAKKGCSIFVTINEGLLKDRKELEKKFKILIKRPEEIRLTGGKNNGKKRFE